MTDEEMMIADIKAATDDRGAPEVCFRLAAALDEDLTTNNATIIVGLAMLIIALECRLGPEDGRVVMPALSAVVASMRKAGVRAGILDRPQ